MKEKELLERITLDPKVMVGKPVVKLPAYKAGLAGHAPVKGTRLTIEYVMNLLAHGATVEGILKEYDGLVQEDIQACLLFAAQSLEERFASPADRRMTDGC